MTLDQKRITLILPINIDKELEHLKLELGSSKSALINLAIEKFLKEQKAKKLQEAVELMQKEYEENEEVSSFTSLDSEPFYETR
jgi:cell division protein ZapA (FtsZ GTPase activity inhibitor)